MMTQIYDDDLVPSTSEMSNAIFKAMCVNSSMGEAFLTDEINGNGNGSRQRM